MDNRVVLEIDSVTKKDNNWDLKFIYSPKDKQKLLESVASFNDLIISSKTFFLNDLEEVFYIRIGSVNHNNPKEIITSILNDDNEALLQTQIDCPTLSKLCLFKIKVMKEGKVGNWAMTSDEELFED